MAEFNGMHEVQIYSHDYHCVGERLKKFFGFIQVTFYGCRSGFEGRSYLSYLWNHNQYRTATFIMPVIYLPNNIAWPDTAVNNRHHNHQSDNIKRLRNRKISYKEGQTIVKTLILCYTVVGLAGINYLVAWLIRSLSPYQR